VPMSDIARLERIRGDEIDQVGDRDVLEYRGTSLPILTLEHMIRAVPRDEIERVYVAVFNVGHSEVGLIVPQICDIREIPATPDKGILEEPGVVGSVVVEGKTTRVLDLHHLAYLSFPEWMASEPPQETRAPQVVPEVSEAPVMPATKAILLAEDSEFFRKRVAGLLEGEGFDVTACEDGAEAWEQLNASPDRFDILVTDIEMPNLTGLELTRKVRSEPRFDGLPIVALTTLASEEDIQRGLDAGVDEYQVKLDRECLLKSVAEVLHQQDAEALQSC